jgi:DNA-binding Lrp family transcriptional regulator
MKAKKIKVLNELRRNSRASLTEIAHYTSIPLSTVYKILNKLETRGIINRHYAVIDFSKLNYPFRVALLVKAKDRIELEKYLIGLENLNNMNKLSGDYDYYAELFFRDLSEYQEFEYKIKGLKSVQKAKLNFLSEIFEERFRIPKM